MMITLYFTLLKMDMEVWLCHSSPHKWIFNLVQMMENPVNVSHVVTISGIVIQKNKEKLQ